MRKRLFWGAPALLALASVLMLIGSSEPSKLDASALQRLPRNAPADTVLAKTPPMGWNSWNHFGCDISAELIKETADAMVQSGMKAAGYEYVNIDDCWMDSTRTPDGRLRPDPKRFPNGIKAVSDYVHSKGLKLGIYESSGTTTCQDYPGSIGHEKIDAQTFAEWGVDYLKYDNCGDHKGEPPRERYRRMHEALEATGRPIVYSICEWGQNQPWNWAAEVGGNLWRTTGDIGPCFGRPCQEGFEHWRQTISQILDQQVGLAEHARPGHWNDPDMLEVGNEGLSQTEAKAHFSLWAILAAPLLAGNDLREMSDATRRILTNEDVIAVNQDPLGRQGTKLRDEGNLEVWVKPLAGGARAVLLLNRWSRPTTMETTARRIGLPEARNYRVRDLWAHKTAQSAGRLRAEEVPAHGIAMFRVRPLR